MFTTLSAKELNPKLFVVTRAIEEESESKLKKAGADRVVMPYELGGTRMVQLLLRPGVIDFIDGVAKDKNVDIILEEITVSANSVLVGKSLAETPIRKDLNIIVIAINKNDGNFIYNPISSSVIEKKDKLIAIGKAADMSRLTDLCIVD